MAGVVRETGYTSYASDSTNKYIPVLYAKKMLKRFYETSVYPEISSTEYQGMIRKAGDTVIIRRQPDITINDYKIGGTINYETPADSNVTLNIDVSKYFAIRMDDNRNCHR